VPTPTPTPTHTPKPTPTPTPNPVVTSFTPILVSGCTYNFSGAYRYGTGWTIDFGDFTATMSGPPPGGGTFASSSFTTTLSHTYATGTYTPTLVATNGTKTSLKYFATPIIC